MARKKKDGGEQPSQETAAAPKPSRGRLLPSVVLAVGLVSAAFIMAEKLSRRTALIDMDIYAGNIALALDIEDVFRLVHECRELWADADAWQRHLLEGACRLTATVSPAFTSPRKSCAPEPSTSPPTIVTSAATVTCDATQAWSSMTERSPMWLDDHITTLSPICTSRLTDWLSWMKQFSPSRIGSGWKMEDET
jgi:hypothetical protein